MNFKGKVAVVTGAGGVICSKVSLGLAKCGADLALVGLSLEELKKVEEQVIALGVKCKSYACDVTNQELVNALADQVIADFGRVDFLVNGAGGNSAKATTSIAKFDPRELEEDRPEEVRGLYNVDMQAFEGTVRLNTMGTVYPILAFAKYMAKEGKGSIVNFASMNTYCPLTRNFAYAMAKSAVENFTKSLAAYFGEAGVRINAVAPGFIVNERSKVYLGTVETGLTARGQKVIDHTPMGRFGEADGMFGCIKFLLDDEASSFVTGVTIPLDGGFLTLSGV